MDRALNKRYKIQENMLKKTSFIDYMKGADIIISVKDSGIANRMKSMASTIRLSENFNKRFGVYWQGIINIQNQDGSPHRAESKFSELFQNNFEVKDIEKYNKGEAFLVDTWRLLVFGSDKIEKGFCNHIDKYAPTGVAIDFEYERIPSDLKKIYSNIFKKFKLRRGIEKKVNGFSKRYFDEDTISVHIRSYSDAAGTRGKKRGVYSFDIDKFINEMSIYKESSKFFVCSDSNDAIDKIKSTFGDRVITYCKEVRTNEDDIIELYLLSKNNLIIGTKNSTFTEVAWWLSECKMDVVII